MGKASRAKARGTRAVTTTDRRDGIERDLRVPLLFVALLCVIAILWAYSNSLHNSFHFDDSHVIENNVAIRSLSNVPRYFTDAHTFSALPQNSTYRPLVTLSYAIDYAVAHRLDPFPFHVTQIIMLLVVGVLLVFFYRPLLDAERFDRRNIFTAVIASAIFCIHTANTETMNFLSSRSELISAIGLLIAFLLVQRSEFMRRTHLYLVFIFLAGLAKAPVFIFAGLLFVYIIQIERKSWRDALKAAIPDAIFGIALLIFLNKMNAPEWTPGAFSKSHYAWTQPFVWIRYVRLFFVPVGLTADSDLKVFDSPLDPRALIGFVFIALLIATIIFLSRRPSLRVAAFGLSWFAIALLPTSSFFPLAEAENEHRLFFSYIGLTIAVVSLAATALLRRRSGNVTAVAVAAIVIIALGIGTHARNRVWATEESLWLDVTQKSPKNGRGWLNYGTTQMSKGKLLVAKAAYERAAQYTPDYWILEINRGIIEGEIGTPEAAEGHFKRALSLNADADSHYYYARWLLKRGRGPEALNHLQEAHRIAPSSLLVAALLVQTDVARGDLATAKALLMPGTLDDSDPAAMVLAGRAPGDSSGWYNEGFAAITRSDFVRAANCNRVATMLKPDNDAAWLNTGWSLYSLHFDTEARTAYQRALALKPNDPRILNNIALLSRPH